MTKPGTVYVIECHGFYKVGITSNLERRLMQFEGGCPFDIRVVFLIEAENIKEARKIEVRAHERLKSLGSHHRLEWFKGLTDSQIKTEVVHSYLSTISRSEMLKKQIKERLQDRGKNRPFFHLSVREKTHVHRRIAGTDRLYERVRAVGVRDASKRVGMSFVRMKKLSSPHLLNKEYSEMELEKFVGEIEKMEHEIGEGK